MSVKCAVNYSLMIDYSSALGCYFDFAKLVVMEVVDEKKGAFCIWMKYNLNNWDFWFILAKSNRNDKYDITLR